MGPGGVVWGKNRVQTSRETVPLRDGSTGLSSAECCNFLQNNTRNLRSLNFLFLTFNSTVLYIARKIIIST